MARFTRRRFSRRRSSGLRWFTPNLWNDPQPAVYSTDTFGGGGAVSLTGTPVATQVLRGSAPFPGVTNSAGLLAGKILAERQYFQLLRIVGRMSWYFSLTEQVDMPNGGLVQLWWAIVRMNTEESGIPDVNTIIDLSDEEEQDDKKTILAQDVWTTSYPLGTSLAAGTLHAMAADPPLFSMIDIKLRRPFRNEQDCFLVTQVGVHANGNALPAGEDITLRGKLNLRVLGRFGR